MSDNVDARVERFKRFALGGRRARMLHRLGLEAVEQGYEVVIRPTMETPV